MKMKSKAHHWQIKVSKPGNFIPQAEHILYSNHFGLYTLGHFGLNNFGLSFSKGMPAPGTVHTLKDEQQEFPAFPPTPTPPACFLFLTVA